MAGYDVLSDRAIVVIVLIISVALVFIFAPVREKKGIDYRGMIIACDNACTDAGFPSVLDDDCFFECLKLINIDANYTECESYGVA
jgi:hypothetical protein